MRRTINAQNALGASRWRRHTKTWRHGRRARTKSPWACRPSQPKNQPIEEITEPQTKIHLKPIPKPSPKRKPDEHLKCNYIRHVSKYKSPRINIISHPQNHHENSSPLPPYLSLAPQHASVRAPACACGSGRLRPAPHATSAHQLSSSLEA